MKKDSTARSLANAFLGALQVGMFYFLAWLWTDGDLSEDLFTVGAILALLLAPRVDD